MTFLIAFLTALLFLFAPVELSAPVELPETVMCSCIPPPPPPEALEASDFVFSGVVTDIKTRGKGEFPMLHVEMRALSIWKGDVDSEIIIETANNSAACGFPFESKKAYLVYGHVYEGQMHASLCSRTALLENAFDDIRDLPTPGSVSKSSPRCGGPTSAVVLQTFVFLFAGMFLTRKRIPRNV